jgi:hypothetical protein
LLICFAVCASARALHVFLNKITWFHVSPWGQRARWGTLVFRFLRDYYK